MQLREVIKVATSKGCTSKAWYTDNRNDYLVKGNLLFDNKRDFGYEPYSEAMVSIIAKHLGIPCVEYRVVENTFKEVKTYNINHVSICLRDTTPKGYQRLSIKQYVELLMAKTLEPYQYWRLLLKLQTDPYYFCSMLLLDAIVGNEDRHLNNWDVLISSSEVHMARLFDNGESLLALVPDNRLSLDFKIGRDASKPFKDSHTRQIALMRRDYPNFKLNLRKAQIPYLLNTILVELKPILTLLPEYRRKCVIKYLHNRFIHYVSMFTLE